MSPSKGLLILQEYYDSPQPPKHEAWNQGEVVDVLMFCFEISDNPHWSLRVSPGVPYSIFRAPEGRALVFVQGWWSTTAQARSIGIKAKWLKLGRFFVLVAELWSS